VKQRRPRHAAPPREHPEAVADASVTGEAAAIGIGLALSGEVLRSYLRLERFGLLVILGLVFFVPPVQTFLSEAIVLCTAAITEPLGIWAEMQPVLRRALFG
jgi:hypothetical protein